MDQWLYYSDLVKQILTDITAYLISLRRSRGEDSANRPLQGENLANATSFIKHSKVEKFNFAEATSWYSTKIML